MTQVDQEPRKSACVGMVGGLALLLFAGTLFATTGPLGEEASAGAFLERRLNVSNSTPPVVAILVETTLLAETLVGDTTIRVPLNSILAGQLLLIDYGSPELVEEFRVAEVSNVADVPAVVVPAAVTLAPASATTVAPTAAPIARRLYSVISLKANLQKAHSAGAIVAVALESLHQQSLHQISSGSSGSLKTIDSSSGSIFHSSNSFESIESGAVKGNVVEALVASGGASGGIGAVVQLLLFLCYGYMYKSKVVDPMGRLPEQSRQYENADDFQFGLCDCFKDCHMCLMVTCCPLIRIAHTNAVTNVCGFWETLCCLWCSTLLCGVGPCCLNVYFRIHIKDHMGIEDHCVNDLILAWCCLPCITGQQGLAVDSTMGFHFKCPCQLERAGGGMYGGQYDQQGFFG